MPAAGGQHLTKLQRVKHTSSSVYMQSLGKRSNDQLINLRVTSIQTWCHVGSAIHYHLHGNFLGPSKEAEVRRWSHLVGLEI